MRRPMKDQKELERLLFYRENIKLGPMTCRTIPAMAVECKEALN